jgi:hypothetical protein
MHPLVGYSDRWSAKPGDPVRFMVSSANDQAYAPQSRRSRLP